MIFSKLNVQFIAIPRCGTGCIFNMLNQVDAHGIPQSDPDHWLYKHGHYRMIDYLKWSDEKDIFTFTFVRNPYARMLSLFSYHKNLESRKQAHGFKGNFQEFCREWKQDSQYLHDWKTQVDYMKNLQDNLDSMNFIGKLESFDEDWKELKRIRIDLPNAMPEFRKIHKSNREKNESYYDEESQDIVRTVFIEDFKLLGYDPNEIP